MCRNPYLNLFGVRAVGIPGVGRVRRIPVESDQPGAQVAIPVPGQLITV